MAINVPGLSKGERRAKHRAVDRVTELETEVARLQRENDEFTCTLFAVTGQLDQAGIDYTGALEDKKAAEETAESLAGELAAAGEEIERLRRQLAPYLAVEANARAVDVPVWERDTSDPADQATGPIDVRELQPKDPGTIAFRFEHGTVRRLGQRTSWGRNPDDQEGAA